MDEKRKEKWGNVELYLNTILLPEMTMEFAIELEKQGMIIETEKNGNSYYIFSNKVKQSTRNFNDELAVVLENLLEKEGL